MRDLLRMSPRRRFSIDADSSARDVPLCAGAVPFAKVSPSKEIVRQETGARRAR